MKHRPGIGTFGVIVVAAVGILVATTYSEGKPQSDLSLRLESFNINLDPAFISDTQSRRIVDMLHAKLVASNERGEFFPQLAESWSWNNNLSLRLKLKPGQLFSNGKTVTSADAVYSLCRLVQPGAPYGWLFSNIVKQTDNTGKAATCTGLHSVDSNTLDIEVSSDPGRLLPSLASSTSAIIPADSKPGEYGSVAGAGPYEIEQIAAGSRVVLKARPGGPLMPMANHVTFQLVQDDSAAATLFRNGQLDAIEVVNPTLRRQLFASDGSSLVRDARVIETNVHQIRLLIFNEASLAKSIIVSSDQIHEWVKTYTGQIDAEGVAKRFSPLTTPIQTSYFPARKVAIRDKYTGPQPDGRGRAEIISENDPYSDSIAAALPSTIGGVNVTHVGLEKGVLISRLLKKDFDIASITLEAMLAHRAYWLAFFEPGSPFTIFGTPLEGLLPSGSDQANPDIQNAKQIDQRGNWFILFQERHSLLLQHWTTGESFLATGLVNYATMGTTR